MTNPIFDLQSLARAPLEAARDLSVIAHALQTLPEISAAVEPLPQAINDIRNIPGIQDAVASLPNLVDAVERVATIEALLLSLIAAVEPALSDVKQLREIVDAQQDQVTHIEAMVQRIERRSQVLERSVVDLQANADEAMRALPDPDDDGRSPLAKARDVITGG
jgi:chromosome segregation ATPase